MLRQPSKRGLTEVDVNKMEKDIRGRVEAEMIKNKRTPPLRTDFWKQTVVVACYKNMIVCFHLVAFLAHEYFTPDWQKEARHITCEVVPAVVEADEVFL